MLAIMAQRLVRLNCSSCSRPYVPTREELDQLGLTGVSAQTRLSRGYGCAACAQTGYLGRSGIYELMVVDDDIRRLIVSKADAATIKQAAVARRMRTLKEEGAAKVLKGLTTSEEVMRLAQHEVEG